MRIQCNSRGSLISEPRLSHVWYLFLMLMDADEYYVGVDGEALSNSSTAGRQTGSADNSV